jgi:hypothetical protein
MQLTTASQELFIDLAKDAGNWGGTPLVDLSPEARGNLTNLKRNGLVTTFRSDGESWVSFTEAGKAYAAEYGVDLSWA